MGQVVSSPVSRMLRLTLSAAIVVFFLTSCAHQPSPVVEPISELNAERYMGTWYEILRMPTSFQRDMSQATASYRLNKDGTFEVVNRGYNTRKGEWKTAVGKARPINDMAAGFSVSFQWPFRGGYYIAELGDDYEYAIIVSDSHDYFWLLSREPRLPRWLIDQTLARAHAWGFDIEQIIETEH